MLGLPGAISALLFDLDGVLTDTASIHFTAWRRTFDELLDARGLTGFSQSDYDDYVDGMPRVDGVRSFLHSRSITLPDGSADDDSLDTVEGVANRKNALVEQLIQSQGVHVYPGSQRYVEAAVAAHRQRAVVTSSANAAAVLAVTGLDRLIGPRVDGTTLAREHLAGKPAPDTYLAGARLLGVGPAVAAVFEDAVAGVQAGRSGGFGYVVGVNRLDADHGRELHAAGADVVVTDLADLL